MTQRPPAAEGGKTAFGPIDPGLINVNYFSGPATIKTPVSWVLLQEAAEPSCSRLPQPT
jgi:hypothetical protein